MAQDLRERCDATASGTEEAFFTWTFVPKPWAERLELKFCAHHNGKHHNALIEAGWTPSYNKGNALVGASVNVSS